MAAPNFSKSMVNQDGSSTPKNTRKVLGYNDICILHAIREDVDAPSEFRNCRAIKADVAGIVRIRYEDDYEQSHNEVLYLNAGIIHQVRNVYRLFQYYVASTAGTAQCYKGDGGTLVNAIKLLR